MSATLSRRKKLLFWGWGYEDEALRAEEEAIIRKSVARRAGDLVKEIAPPTEDEMDLPAPRIKPPAALEDLFSATPYDRLIHCFGKSFPDMVRMLMRKIPCPPDLVAFPRNEQNVIDVLDWASRNNIAVIPYGGGTSVCGGVEGDVGDGYDGAVSLDLQYLNRIIEIDHTSRAALIEAGAIGPEIESHLRKHDLTLRHFPQSFAFSTLGGWIATRSGGHYASVYTHIDDFVESTRLVAPNGVMQTRRLPGSGAGPSPDRWVIGSEGILGVITQAWVRLQNRPRFRSSASVHFAEMAQAVAAVRALSQSALFPTNCRLLDAAEARGNRLGETPVLLLGFESADHPTEAWLARALELAKDHGGTEEKPEKKSSPKDSSPKDSSHLAGAMGSWRDTFIRMPYYRNLSTRLGLISDTFETAISWSDFDNLYHGAREKMQNEIKRITGDDVVLSCRFTHIYPDGPAPYFSFTALGTKKGDLPEMLEKWIAIKQAANEVVVGLGGTVTHHHAVGRDHRSGYDQQMPPLFREGLRAAKSHFDPAGILNPGILIDPANRALSRTGALA